MTVPSALPTVVPAGRYLCEIAGDPVQKASQFAEGKFYLELSLRIRNEKGQWFDFPLSTTVKSPRYHQILQVCGGQLLPNGVTMAPESLIGKKFIAKITERLSRDGKRQVNEVLEVFPYVAKEKAALATQEPVEPTAEPEELTDDEGEVVPF
jgi:predicted nuclease with RNAse H fold